MHLKSFEFKAKVKSAVSFEEILLQFTPEFIGEDHQIDTYFNATTGRLKLREGTIENALIAYERENNSSSKSSKIILYQHQPNPALKEILALQLGIKVVVDKIRRIYKLENVKFHFDQVEGLGEFIEVEAIYASDSRTLKDLQEQCDLWLSNFLLNNDQLIDVSYSDLLLATAIKN